MTSIPEGLSFVRGFYFSIVTMTTLGFGDISANPSNWLSHFLIITNVLSGYLILGALVTVLSSLFAADGPSQGLVPHPDGAPRKVRAFIRTEPLKTNENS